MDLKVNEEWLKSRVLEMAGKNRLVEVTAAGEKNYKVRGKARVMTVSASASQTGDGITLNIRLEGIEK